jgi:hypothetical protein
MRIGLEYTDKINKEQVRRQAKGRMSLSCSAASDKSGKDLNDVFTASYHLYLYTLEGDVIFL